jgi:plasmid replication initiation protein
MIKNALTLPDDRKPLKKSVETLAIVPKKDRISILARKVYNVMMHYAQEQGIEQPVYRVRLRDIVVGIDFNSKNDEIIKEHLRQMVTTKIEWQSPTKGEGAKWTVSALIAHAELIKEKGELFLEWSYAINIKAGILNPERFARISLAFQSEFKSMPGLVLYEICSRYVQNEAFEGLTPRQHWTWWRPVLTGAPEDQVGIYLEWKYFNRDVIKKAVIEVNQITNFEVKVIEHAGKGRAIGDIQFSVRLKMQKKLPLTTPTPVNLKDIGRAIVAGVHQEKAESLLSKHGDKNFTEAIDALEKRQKRTNQEPVADPYQYLKAVILDNEKNPTPIPLIKEASKDRVHITAKRVEMIESYRQSKRQEALSLFNESVDSEQERLLSTFETELLPSLGAAVQAAYQKKRLTTPMTKSYFNKFLASHFFGEGWDSPTDSELLDFSVS